MRLAQCVLITKHHILNYPLVPPISGPGGEGGEVHLWGMQEGVLHSPRFWHNTVVVNVSKQTIVNTVRADVVSTVGVMYSGVSGIKQPTVQHYSRIMPSTAILTENGII